MTRRSSAPASVRSWTPNRTWKSWPNAEPATTPSGWRHGRSPTSCLWTSACRRATDWTATRRILADPAVPGTRVIILTTFELDEYIAEAVRAGAAGFLVKDTEPEELLRAVRVVHDGDALLSPSVTRRIMAQLALQHPRGRQAARRRAGPDHRP